MNKAQKQPNQHALITDFLTYGANDLAYSVHTLKGYRSSLNAFAVYLAATHAGTGLLDVAAPHLIAYDQSRARTLKPRSRARNIAALRAFYLWLTDEAGIVKVNPSLKLKPPELDASSRSCPLGVIRARLIEATGRLRDEHRAVLARALLGTMFHAGLRPDEVCQLELGDVILQEVDSFLVVQAGKGRKRREVAICDDLAAWLQNWLGVRNIVVQPKKPPKVPLSPSPAFFIHGPCRRPMSQHVIRSVLAEVKAIAGVRDANLTPHSLRHSFATTLDEAGEDISVIQQLLGHQNITTTQRYVHPTDKRKFAAVQKLNAKPTEPDKPRVKPYKLLKRQR